MKILVIQKKMMGDVLVSSIIFDALKEKFPQAELHYLIGKNNYQVIQNHKNIDKVLFFGGFFETIRKVRNEKYDIIIDSYSKVETACVSFLSSAPKRISFYKKYISFLYTDTIKRSHQVQFPILTTALEHRLQLLLPLGIEIKERKPFIYSSEQENKQADELLQRLGIDKHSLLMISTFGSCPEKTYPVQYMAQVIDFVASKTNATILCNYLPQQKEDFIRLYDSLSEETKNKVVRDFDTQNLRQYIAIVRRCKALIGNEGGSTNISKALEIPTFSIYAPFVRGWEWFEDGNKNVLVHCEDYQKNTYQDFKPELFQEKLHLFIQNNIK